MSIIFLGLTIQNYQYVRKIYPKKKAEYKQKLYHWQNFYKMYPKNNYELYLLLRSSFVEEPEELFKILAIDKAKLSRNLKKGLLVLKELLTEREDLEKNFIDENTSFFT